MGEPTRPSAVGTYVIGAARIEGGAKVSAVTRVSSAGASRFEGNLPHGQGNSLFSELPTPPSQMDTDAHLQSRIAAFEVQLEDLVARSVFSLGGDDAGPVAAPSNALDLDDDEEEEETVSMMPASSAVV